MSDPRLTDPGHACDCIHHDSDHEAPALRAEVERLRAELAAAEALHVKTLDREDDWMKRLGRANARAEAMEALARELMGWLAEWRQPKPKLETIEEDLRPRGPSPRVRTARLRRRDRFRCRPSSLRRRGVKRWSAPGRRQT